MELAAGAMSSVLPKLSALLTEEVKLSKGLRREVMFIEAEVSKIHEFILREMEAEPTMEQAMFLRDARELSYDIEDSVDGFMFRMKHEPDLKLRKGFFDKSIGLLTKAKIRRQFATEISDIKWRVEEVIQQRRRYIIDFPSSTSDAALGIDPRVMAFYMEPSALVGLDGPRDEIIELLLKEEEEEPESAARLKVISIVGSGGLGKTTLANEVYTKTKVYFHCSAWVSFSRNPNLKEILTSMLRQFNNYGHESELDESQLTEKIRTFLQNKRYLCIMDDLWSPNPWDIIRCALPMNTLGSRIIVTTRIINVAESCCSQWNDRIYNIKPLSMTDSRLLFHRRIFGSLDKCPPDMLDISDKILNKCSGLPLAIITMASLLANRPLEKPIWEHVYNSVGFTPQRLEGMKSIFLLSYYDLPQHLKVCFLYLSIFPEDYLIIRERVVRSWIAEGFISTKYGLTAEEVGENYLNELINRNLIHPVHGSYVGKPEAYQIHGIMHDLIKSKSVDENFVTLIENGNHVPRSHGKIRRLSIINISKDHCIPELEYKSHIRSLYIFDSVGLNLSFKHLRFLRVMDMEGCKDLIDHNIKELPELIQLRYLNLRDTNISRLPDQIGHLQSLKTLDLRGTKVKELPTSIVQLRMLAHLLCDKIRFPKGIGDMASLSCMSQVDIFQSNILVLKELGDLSELRELDLWWFPDKEFDNTLINEQLAVSLYRLDKLQSLYIHGSDCSVEFLDFLHYPLRQLRIIHLNRCCYLNRIPKKFSELLPTLAYLCIDIDEVKNENLQVLSELPSLIQLSLSSKAMPKERLVISSKGFPLLQKFHLHSANKDLKFEPQAMQKLEELVLSFHVLPEDFSISIGQFTCLKKIDIRINGKGVAASQLIKFADAAIRKPAHEHPNHPVVNITAEGNLIDYEAMEGNEREEKAGASQRQIMQPW